MSTPIDQYYANHRWFVIGGIGAAVAALVALLQLRKTTTPVVNVTTPTPVTNPPIGLDELGAAVAAGAAAALAGFQAQQQPTPPIDTPIPPEQPAPPPPAPPTPPPPVSPVPTPGVHTATVTGSSGLVYGYPPVIGKPIVTPQGKGVSASVVQEIYDGVLWWGIVSGPLSGAKIQYHDPAWSVSP